MGNTVLGVVAPLPQGEWNSTTTYQKLSVVREGNSSYIAKSANVNIQPGVTDSWETYWMLLNEDGDTGQQGPQGETGVGVPDGGLKGDLLVKRSQANYDDEWVDPDNITVGNATKAVQDENGNNIADTYQTKQEATTQNTVLQTQITSNTQGITRNSQLISRNSARLTNLEQRISPSPFVTDSTVAYVKDVPANALPYAELQKLGGMTRKCTNLFPQGTISGIEGVSNNLPSEAPAGTYTISGIASSDDTDATNCRILITGTDDSQIEALYPKRNEMFSYTFTANVAIKKLSFWASGNTANSAGDSFTFKNIMLNQGATALPYEPYFEGLRSAPVTSAESVGVNLLPYPYYETTKTTRGITVTDNGDGSLTLNGTSTGDVYFTLANGFDAVNGVAYRLSDNIDGTSIIFTYEAPDGSKTYPNSITKTNGYTILNIRLHIKPNLTFNNAIVYPMLNKGTTALHYTPYTKSTLPIPEAVQALDGYGDGINESVYNYITWNPEGNVKTYTKAVETVVFDGIENITSRGKNAAGLNVFLCSINPFAKIAPLSTDFDFVEFVTGASPALNGSATDGAFYMLYNSNTSSFNSVYFISSQATVEDFKQSIIGKSITYALATPEVTDISDLITADNLLPVQGNGTITFVNEYGYAVPSTVEYMT